MKNFWAIRFVRELCGQILGRAAAIWAFAAKPHGGKYELSHLVQAPSQQVITPVQDDEALFLFGIVRGMRMRAVLEVGGAAGYSALNFARALVPDEKNLIVTLDIISVPKVADNHETLQKDAGEVGAQDLSPLLAKHSLPPRFDLVFFDAHVYDEQSLLLKNLREAGMIDGGTVLAFHDTCPKRPEYAEVTNPNVEFSRNADGEEVAFSCPEERRMIEDLRGEYHVFNLHPRREYMNDNFPFRHGVTVLQKKAGH